jgi:hypothetical protein
MDDNNRAADELKAALQSTSARVIHNRQEWDDLVAAEGPERSALLKELTAFAELCEYFERQQLVFPHDIVADLSGIENLSIEARTQLFREINERLLARVPYADSDSKSRM